VTRDKSDAAGPAGGGLLDLHRKTAHLEAESDSGLGV
jgi:hypothetical protein